jgi:hypothetical protein
MLDEALSHNVRAFDRQMSGFFTNRKQASAMERLVYTLSLRR